MFLIIVIVKCMARVAQLFKQFSTKWTQKVSYTETADFRKKI